MTGQIDIGWAVPPFALRELQEKKIVIVARAREATELQDQTIRVNIANVESLKTKRAAITRLMQVYDEAIDWAYTNPKAIDYFAEFAKVAARHRQAGGGRVLSEGGAADRRNPRPRPDAQRRAAVQVHHHGDDAEGRRAGLFDILYKPRRGERGNSGCHRGRRPWTCIRASRSRAPWLRIFEDMDPGSRVRARPG